MQLFGNFVILIDLRRKLENYILNFNLYADYDSDDYRYGSFIMRNHFFENLFLIYFEKENNFSI